jgi:hypothetical protein
MFLKVIATELVKQFHALYGTGGFVVVITRTLCGALLCGSSCIIEVM